MGDGKSERCLMLVELELDTCQDWHPCSSVPHLVVINLFYYLRVVTFIVRIVLSSFNIRLRDFIYILYEFFAMCEVYACVTKHGIRCPSPAGANQVSSGASIDFVEIYAYEKCSLFI